ncbi:MAG: hypothetical protein AAFU64_09765, partial [Bacteroidota bacterium]
NKNFLEAQFQSFLHPFITDPVGLCLEMQRLTNARFWIQNLKHMEPSPETEPNWISDEWMQETLELGLEKILIVVSPAIFEEPARADLQQRQVFPQDIVAFFSDEAEARNYLTSLI